MSGSEPVPHDSPRQEPGERADDPGLHDDIFGRSDLADPVPPSAGPYGYPPAPLPVPPPPASGGRHRGLTALGVAALALVAGTVGGIAGGRLVQHHDGVTLVDPAVSLPAPVSGSAQRPAGSVAAVAAAVLPSVVTIKVSGASEAGTGSGFVLDARGYVLTNNHVVAPAAAGGSLRVVFQDGRQVDGRIVGRDAGYDLAVVKADVGSRRALTLGDSDAVRVGDPVIAVGAPLGLQGTVTTGIVSARNRPVAAGEAQDASFINALQTDAAINPGNSGGPLLDAAGRVVGVNSAIARVAGGVDATGGNIGVGFAIPSNQARRTAQQLIRTGHAEHPVIGAVLGDAGDGGVRVAAAGAGGRPAVTPGGPADRAGIAAGDVIIAIDGHPVASPADLVVAIRAHSPGDVVRLTVRRAGTDRTVPVRLAASGS